MIRSYIIISCLLLSISTPTSHACHSTIEQNAKHFFEENTDYEAVFKSSDSNNNKCLESNEVTQLLIKMDIPWRCRWTSQIISKIDTNNNQCIEFNEITRLIT